MQKTIAVFGSSQTAPGSDAYQEAYTVGQLLAEAGFSVINGGYGGTMQGASQGAADAGGNAIGVTCAIFDRQRPGGNPYLSSALHTPDLVARLRQLTERADGFIVLQGGVGTLLELFLVWNLLTIGVIDKPCVLLGKRWSEILSALQAQTQIESHHIALLNIAHTPQKAVQIITTALGR